MNYNGLSTFFVLLKPIILLNKCIDMITVFWGVTAYNLVDVYQHFRGLYCLNLQDRRVTF